MPPIQNDVEFVLRTVEERDVHFIQFWFADVLGNLKSFAATSGELEDALVEGLGFDGSSIEGFSAVEESDCVALPDSRHLPDPAVAPAAAGGRAHVLRHQGPGRRGL